MIGMPDTRHVILLNHIWRLKLQFIISEDYYADNKETQKMPLHERIHAEAFFLQAAYVTGVIKAGLRSLLYKLIIQHLYPNLTGN